MKLAALGVAVAGRVLAAILTEKVLVNLVFVLAEWLVKRTKNDLDDKLFEALKEGLDKQGGKPVNLYSELRK